MIRGNDSDVVVVWTTFPADGDVESFGRALVSEDLAACVTAGGDALSIYMWNSSVHVVNERPITIKTTAHRVARLQRRIAELHPYDVPEFLVLAVQGGSAGYLDWVRSSVSPSHTADIKPDSN